jgi:hypothetical protein
MTGWKCPQQGCTRPLNEHLVTQADQFCRDNPTKPAPGGKQSK